MFQRDRWIRAGATEDEADSEEAAYDNLTPVAKDAYDTELAGISHTMIVNRLAAKRTALEAEKTAENDVANAAAGPADQKGTNDSQAAQDRSKDPSASTTAQGVPGAPAAT